jgi:hypothetical protein
MFDLQFDKKKKKKREKTTTFLCEKCRNTTAHKNVLLGNTLYYMKWIKYKTVCAELSFAIATLDRMVAAFI